MSQTYPSGRKVGFDYNLDGDISSIRGTTAAGQNRLYLNGITYNAAGQMTRLRLGNGKWESTEYNDRLQVTEIGLGNSADDKSTLRLEYGYGDNTKNNGSLRNQKITFAGLAAAYEQAYTYDDLNRLKSAEEKIGTTTNWKQSFNYDRFGNRTFDAANTTTISTSNTVTNPSASTATNRLNGYTYDQAGNLTVDAENRRFVYDAENHQTKLFLSANSSGTPDAIYKYDGEGRRVKKISSTETTVFVYDGGGTLVAEYTALTGNDPAPTPQVSYLTADHLGSPRVVTNQNGEVIKRTDWMAFGEEVEFNKRASGLGYDQVPETRKGYTGYEKDDESGLDFAQARYYNPKHGRFTSVDPLTASANVKNPQTFNRYSYVLNSPYKFTDPLGLIASDTGACGNWCSNSGPMVDGSAIRGTDYSMTENLVNRIYQREIRTITVTQTEADGRQATITITVQTDRVIDRRTGRVLESSNPIVTATAANTGSVAFSSQDLSTMRDVSRDIVEVSISMGVDPRVALAMAQRETHLGIGAIGDPRNKGKEEMNGRINPLQLDGDANKKYSATMDRKENIRNSLRLFSEIRSDSLEGRLGQYNSGGNIGP